VTVWYEKKSLKIDFSIFNYVIMTGIDTYLTKVIEKLVIVD